MKLEILDDDYRKYFDDDPRPRAVYKCRISRGGKQYTFNFGASYADPSEPTMYDVLECFTKYDVGSFSDFCSDFGYDEYVEDWNTGRYGINKKAMRLYKAVQREYKAVERLFGDVMDELQEIS